MEKKKCLPFGVLLPNMVNFLNCNIPLWHLKVYLISKQKISPSVLQHQRGRMTENQDEVILGGQVYYITLTAISQDGR